MFYRRKVGTKVEYVVVAYIRLCFDVLGDVLQFGSRRELSALERIGRYFHVLIDERFVTKPFLTLTLKTFFDWPVEKGRRRGDGLIFSEPEAPVDQKNIKTDVGYIFCNIFSKY